MHVSPARHALARFVAWLRQNWVFAGYFAVWFVYFTYFWWNAITVESTGAVRVGHVSIWGDWAAHFTMGSAMAERGPLLLTSPFLYGAHFSYPFVANMVSAILYRLGVPFFSAFLVPSYLFSLLFVVVLYWFYLKLFKRHLVALTASLIFLLNGGTGFVYFFDAIKKSEQPWQTLLNPPLEYTSMQEHFIRWISVINSQLIPQRAFTFGFPLAIMVLTLIWFYCIKNIRPAPSTLNLSERHKRQRLSTRVAVPLAAVLLGLMPIIHTHSFLAIGIILAFWFASTMIDSAQIRRRSWKMWLHIGVPGALLALPLIYFFILSNASGDGFIKWFPGWYLQEFDVNWFLFWFLNWGVVPILAIVGWCMHVLQQSTWRARLQEILFYTPFFVLFALMNLFLFQPFIWDNTKILSWVSLGFSGLSAYALITLWDRKKLHIDRHWLLNAQALGGRAVIVGIFLFCILSGGIDAWRVLRFKLHSYQMYSEEDMTLVAWVKRNTRSDSLWVTGDMHNHWLFNLTGRQALMTYRGWLWTHGYHYTPIEADVTMIYRNPNAAQPILNKYGVDYVLIGFNEESTWGASKQAFDQVFPVVYQTANYTIYQAKQVEQ